MSQVYPIGDERVNAHSLQLARSLREYRAINDQVLQVPTGAACNHPYTLAGKTRDWLATPAQVTDFFEACEREGLSGANIWEWDQARMRHPQLWAAIAAYPWPGSESEPAIAVPPIGAGEPAPPASVSAATMLRRMRRLWNDFRIRQPH
jgi:hypothetical protein